MERSETNALPTEPLTVQEWYEADKEKEVAPAFVGTTASLVITPDQYAKELSMLESKKQQTIDYIMASIRGLIAELEAFGVEAQLYMYGIPVMKPSEDTPEAQVTPPIVDEVQKHIDELNKALTCNCGRQFKNGHALSVHLARSQNRKCGRS